MDLPQAMDTFDGVARVRALLDLGIGDRAIRKALASGTLRRVRRDWVAAPGADPMLVAAAELGVRLTCVSLAERLGVWASGGTGIHVAAPANGKLLRAPKTAVHVHWATPPIPRTPDRLVDSVENMLAILATCQPYEAGLAAWESALQLGMIDRSVVARLPLGPDARRLLAEARPFADAGIETIFSSRLSWLKTPMQRQVALAGRPVDLLIGQRLVIQIDGSTHVGAQRLADIEHDARLRLMGYTVFRFGYWQIMDDWPTVQGLVTRAIAQGLHLSAA